MQVEMKLDGLEAWDALLDEYREELKRELHRAFVEITVRWQREAVLRVPVDTGRLRQGILREVKWETAQLVGKVGSNVKYAPHIEFGTDRIAYGLVKALGTGPEITDQQAIKDWPAKFSRGASRQQMPYLRPAFMHIRAWAIQRIYAALKPPGAMGQ